MIPAIPTRRRGLSAALAALHLALVLGAGVHQGAHLDEVVAELPAEFHHHAYDFAAAPADDPRPADPCVACMLSRLVPRLPAPPAAIPAAPPAARAARPAYAAAPDAGPLDPLGPRAPPAL